MRDIPEEARAIIAAYREGKTEKQFLDYIWSRRRTEHPGKIKSTGEWPVKALELPVSNVTQIKRAKK